MLRTTLKALLMIVTLFSLTAEATPARVIPKSELITVPLTLKGELSSPYGFERQGTLGTNTQVLFGFTKSKPRVDSPPKGNVVPQQLSVDEKRAIMNLMIDAEVNKRLLRMNYIYTAVAAVFVMGVYCASSYK